MGRWPLGRTCAFRLINSIVECSLAITKDCKARIATSELEKDGLVFECAVTDNVVKIFQEQGVPRDIYDYGLVVLSPGERIAESEVVDFISFHRHPEYEVEEPTSTRYGISSYTEAFDKLVRKQEAFIQAYPPPCPSEKQRVEKRLKDIIM